MKVGFVMWMPSVIAGGNFVIYKHAEYLASRGHDVTILFVNEGKGLEVSGCHRPGVPVVLIAEAIKRNRVFDVLIATFWPTFYYMFGLKAKHYMYFVQSDERRFFESQVDSDLPFVQRTYCEANVGIITEAQWIKRELELEFKAKVEYAPNGIDTSMFNPRVKPLRKRGKKIRVLIEGPGEVFFKRIDLAFKVVNQFRDIEVWYVSSDGACKPEWKCNRFFKEVDFCNMPGIYRSCDILLKLSIVEGCFGPPLEMMACGGAAVVSNVSGHEEYVIHGENALVVEMDNEREAYEALKRLIEDGQLRSVLSSNGIETAKKLDWAGQCPLFEQAVMRHVGRRLMVSTKERTDVWVLRSLLESKWAQQWLEKRWDSKT